MALFGGMGNESTKKYEWKEEEMYRWRLQIDATMMHRGDLRGKIQEVKFEFKQSVETGGEQFSCIALASFRFTKQAPKAPRNIGINVGVVTANRKGAGAGRIKPLPQERFSLKVDTPMGTKIFEGGPCLIEFDEIPDMLYAYPMIKITEKTFDELQMQGGGWWILTFILKTKTPTTEKIFWPSETDIKEKCYKMFTKMENDEKKSDLKIITSDGREFFAYRWILTEVSAVFEARFRCGMKEKESGVLKMDDLSGTTVKTLLHFIYSGEVAKEWSGTARELMYAAHKYQIGELKKFLDANVGTICTAENAGALLAMAEKTSLKKAVADILAFIREQCKDPKGFFESVKKTKTD